MNKGIITAIVKTFAVVIWCTIIIGIFSLSAYVSGYFFSNSDVVKLIAAVSLSFMIILGLAIMFPYRKKE